MLLRKLTYGAIVLIFSGVLLWCIAPTFSAEAGWRPVAQAAPPGLAQQLDQDYAPQVSPGDTVEVGQMQMLKLQQLGSLPLYLINTRVHPIEHPNLTPTCGTGGCLFLGYIPSRNGFRQVLNGLIDDFHVQGKPPVIQPIQRVLNHVPCLQLNTYNARTQSMNPRQVLCFNGGEFVPASEESIHSEVEKNR